jgi:outer membrane murein-binding lipoprotein Lpp
MSSSMLINRSAYPTSTGTKKLHAFVAALIVAAALPGCAVFPQSSNPTDDQKITADVETRFGQHAELEDDVSATRRALASQDGPTVLVGHSVGA